jgi:hypothetical protein
LGTTLIKIEMARQYRMCGLWAKMGQVQEALNKENEEKKLDKDKNNLSLN